MNEIKKYWLAILLTSLISSIISVFVEEPTFSLVLDVTLGVLLFAGLALFLGLIGLLIRWLVLRKVSYSAFLRITFVVCFVILLFEIIAIFI